MLMGLSDILSLAKTPEQREEMKTMIINLMNSRDEDIDYSDIPERTDFSGSQRGKPHFDAMREHNRRIWEQEEQLKEHENTEAEFEQMEVAL